MRKNHDVQAAYCQGVGGHSGRVRLDEHRRVRDMPQVRHLAYRVRQLAQEVHGRWQGELAAIGGNGRSDPAKATSKEIESPKIVVGEQALADAELEKKSPESGECERVKDPLPFIKIHAQVRVLADRPV